MVADLIDDQEEDVPEASRLRLSLTWRSITSDPSIADKLEGTLAIGLFVGQQPLFSPAVYERWRPDFVLPGFFRAEDSGCNLLRGIWATLRTRKRFDFEDTLRPYVRVIISPDLLDPDSIGRSTNRFEVLVIIQHGGPWHGDAMGSSGPGALLVVRREQLEKFFYDLLDEAVPVCNELARTDLAEAFAEPLAVRHAHAQG